MYLFYRNLICHFLIFKNVTSIYMFTCQKYMDLLPRRSKLSTTSAFAGDPVVTRELNKSKSSSTVALLPPFVIELVPESNPPKPGC